MNYTINDIEDIYPGRAEDENNSKFVNCQLRMPPDDFQQKCDVKLEDGQYVCTYVDVKIDTHDVWMLCIIEGEIEEDKEIEYVLTNEEMEEIYNIVKQYCKKETGCILETYFDEYYN